jgi:hypothetical protein
MATPPRPKPQPQAIPRKMLVSCGGKGHAAVMLSLAHHFGLESSAQLQWAHRVNNPTALSAACADPAVHVLEADVYFGQSDATPLVKTHRNATSELDIASWLTTTNMARKAFKLDFHTPAAVEPTLGILRLLNLPVPMILHADVFSLLSARNRHESLEPEQFIRLVSTALPKAIVSVGWSLKRPHDADGRVEDALVQQLAAMLLQRLGPVSYGLEIRAGYAPTRDGVAGERGATLLLDPLPAPEPALSATQASNVVSILSRLRRVA